MRGTDFISEASLVSGPVSRHEFTRANSDGRKMTGLLSPVSTHLLLVLWLTSSSDHFHDPEIPLCVFMSAESVYL